MTSPQNDFSTEKEFNRYGRRIRELRQALSNRNPNRIAVNTSCTYHPYEGAGGEFHLLLWEKEVSLSFPDLVAYNSNTREELSQMELVLLLYYFNTADGTPLSGQWISFSELPDGKFYNQAFQGYTGQLLSQSFKDDRTLFETTAQLQGARHYPLGDASFTFQVLPRVPVLVVHWQGDEDFPASFQILFDSSAGHYLPTDAYAIIGSILTQRLIKAKDH